VLVQADESIIAIIKKIDKEANGLYILEELDSETCLVSHDKQDELQRRVKEVGLVI
jgi:DNA-binding LytR/AlgR family response regulator